MPTYYVSVDPTFKPKFLGLPPEIETVRIFIGALKGCMSLRGWSSPVPATRSMDADEIARLKEKMRRFYPALKDSPV